MSHAIPLSAPQITQQDIDAVAEALRSGTLSMGPKTDAFELACARATGRSHAVAVCSGTAALHCALAGLGLGENDEIITSPFSYIATTNCILYTRAKPVFVDINPQTLNIDASKAEAAITPCTRAILAVAALGHPGGMDELEQLARRHELTLIEDACEGLGAALAGRPAGSFGRVSCISFSASQQITAGEGGAVVTDDDRLAEICRSLRNQGRDGTGWLTHQRLGFNYRISELNAALGHCQLLRAVQLLEQRRQAAREYFDRLIENRYITLPTIPEQITMSWFAFAVRLNDLFEPGDRDEIMRDLRSEGIGCGNYYPVTHLAPHVMQQLGTRRGDFPVAEYIAERTIVLPLFASITAAQIDRVCDELDRAIEKVLMGRCKGRF